ncbi:hypothetical protein AAW12_05130 [Sphingobacterium sp. Ag1]|nr:hypothetical protein AAW12_05130 [Sphingobacterium sp. Ag1]
MSYYLFSNSTPFVITLSYIVSPAVLQLKYPAAPPINPPINPPKTIPPPGSTLPAIAPAFAPISAPISSFARCPF